MTAHKLALIKTAKMIGIAGGTGLVIGLADQFGMMSELFTLLATGVLLFLIKMTYEIKLSQAREELQERNIDNSAR